MYLGYSCHCFLEKLIIAFQVDPYYHLVKRRRFLADFGRRLREAGVETAPLTGPVAPPSGGKRKRGDADVRPSFMFRALQTY